MNGNERAMKFKSEYSEEEELRRKTYKKRKSRIRNRSKCKSRKITESEKQQRKINKNDEYGIKQKNAGGK